MSLINQMLQDLESRKTPEVEPVLKKPVYEDLKPISAVSRSRAPSRRLTGLVALIVVVGAGAYAWMQWGDGLMQIFSADEVAVKPAHPVARKAPPKPAPVSSAAVATAPEVVAAVPAPADQAKPETLSPPMAPEVPAAQTPKAEAPVVSAPVAPKISAPTSPTATAKKDYWIVSKGETLYSISVKSGVDLWHLSKWNGLNREHVIQPGQRLRLTAPAATATSVSGKPAEPVKPVTSAKVPAGRTTGLTASSLQDNGTSGNAVMDRRLKPLSAEEKAEGEYRRAVDLLQKGRPGDAERHLKSALAASDTHTKSRELYAGLLLQQGHWRETQQLLEKGIEKVPAYYPFAQLLARVYVEHGADQKALTVMEQSRGAAADNPEYAAFLAALYQRAGKHAEAVKTYSEALALHPQEGRWWLGMGISLEAIQDGRAAGAAYQKAIDSGALDENLLTYARQRMAVVKNK